MTSPDVKRAGAVRLAATICAVALAVLIFVADLQPDLPVAVSVLYILALTLGSWRRGRLAVLGWTGACVVLALVGFLHVHGFALDPSSMLRMAFALSALLITCVLLLSRLELQATRAALQASETNMQNFANSVPQILWRGYADGSCDFINGRLEETTGLALRPGEREIYWTNAIHPDDREHFLTAMSIAFTRQREFRFDLRIQAAEGGFRRAIAMARPAPDPANPGNIAYYGGISDVTAEFEAQEQVRQMAQVLEQRVAQRTEELARSEKRFRSLFYDMNIAFAETDTSVAKALLEQARQNGATDFQTLAAERPDLIDRCLDGIQFMNMNDAFAQMLGHETGDTILAVAKDTLIENPRELFLHQLQAIFEERRLCKGMAALLRKNGTRILVAYQVNYPSDWTYGLITVVDITEQQHAQELVLAANEELARANRIATLGALSSSLAHELNQPITSLAIDIRTSLRHLEEVPPNVAQGILAIQRLTANVDRMTGIVKRTRDRVVRGHRKTETVDLCELARDTQSLLHRDLGNRGAALQIACEPDLPDVAGDRVELQQVLVNLIINAADAMIDVNDRERLIQIGIGKDAQEVVVTVSDNGPGIAEAHRSQIFQPFFTTKPEGMGMGLQICRSIIEAFDGKLSVQNRDGGGASFRFTVPVVDPDA